VTHDDVDLPSVVAETITDRTTPAVTACSTPAAITAASLFDAADDSDSSDSVDMLQTSQVSGRSMLAEANPHCYHFSVASSTH